MIHAGYTLIQLIVVLSILALLAAIGAVKLRAPYQAAQLESAKERIVWLDGHLRRRCVQSASPAELIFDLREHRVRLLIDSQKDSQQFDYPLSGGTRLAALIVAGQTVSTGSVSIPVSPLGETDSYAVHLKTSTNDRGKWLHIAGGTGQPHEPESEADVHHLWETTAASRSDSD